MKSVKIILLISISIILVFLSTGCYGETSKIQEANIEIGIDNIKNNSNDDIKSKEKIEKKEDISEIKPFTWKEEIYGLQLGMNIDEVKNILGEPLQEQKVNTENEGEITTIKYDNLTIQFKNKIDNKITKIEMEGYGDSVTKGIKIGDNFEVLNNKFYQEEIVLSKDKKEVVSHLNRSTVYYHDDKDFYTITYFDTDYNYIALIFEVKDTKIIKVTLIYQTV